MTITQSIAKHIMAKIDSKPLTIWDWDVVLLNVSEYNFCSYSHDFQYFVIS